jgi:hypothetical protein
MIDLKTFPLPPFEQRRENAIELACYDERYEARQNMTSKEWIEKGLVYNDQTDEIGIIHKIQEVVPIENGLRYVCDVNFGWLRSNELFFVDIIEPAKMKKEDLEITISVIKGNIAGLEMMNSEDYLLLEQTEEFKGYTGEKLGDVIARLVGILNALETINRIRANSQSEEDIVQIADSPNASKTNQPQI